MPDAGAPDPIASRSPLLVWLFCFYAQWKFSRSFHALRLARADAPAVPAGRPLIIYSNHPSWWDPLLFFLLQRRCFPGGAGFGPMDGGSLEKYGVFKPLGVFGIAPGARGAARFLETSARILRQPGNVLWVTAEGAFTDARERPLRLRPGIAHLARRTPNVVLIPMAIEYTFWNESKPEALARFGRPIAADGVLSVADWTARLEAGLSETMDALQAASMTRDPKLFDMVTYGSVGVGGPYDLWRYLRAVAAGRRFDPTHEGREA